MNALPHRGHIPRRERRGNHPIPSQPVHGESQRSTKAADSWNHVTPIGGVEFRFATHQHATFSRRNVEGAAHHRGVPTIRFVVITTPNPRIIIRSHVVPSTRYRRSTRFSRVGMAPGDTGILANDAVVVAHHQATIARVGMVSTHHNIVGTRLQVFVVAFVVANNQVPQTIRLPTRKFQVVTVIGVATARLNQYIGPDDFDLVHGRIGRHILQQIRHAVGVLHQYSHRSLRVWQSETGLHSVHPKV